MQTRLRRQGIVLPLAGGALLFGLECVGTVYGAGDWHGVIRAGELAFNGGFALVFALFLYAIRSIRRLPFHREVRYRYEHGKWRWER